MKNVVFNHFFAKMIEFKGGVLTIFQPRRLSMRITATHT